MVRFFSRLISFLLSCLLLFSCALAQEREILESARANCSANVREQAGTRYEIAFVLSPGEQVDVYSMTQEGNNVWCFIRVSASPQRKGYVLRELLDFEPEPITHAAASSAAEPTGNSRRVEADEYLAAIRQGITTPEDLFTAQQLDAYETLKKDSRGDDVLRMKNRLYDLGYYAKEQTGPLYTDSTAQIVTTFQQINSLPPSGEATPLTLALLYSEFALGADAQQKHEQPIVILDGRLVRYDSSSAVQIEWENQSRQSITGFTVEIIPYSTYSEPVALFDTLGEALQKTWSCSGIQVNHGGRFDCVSQKEYFVISAGRFFTGALVSVSSYTTRDGLSVPIDAASRHWYSIGTADASDLSMPEKILISQDSRHAADAFSLGFSSIYMQPALQRLYGAPEGAAVTSVDPFSPAAEAGLMGGDVIVCINSVRITGEDSIRKAKSLIVPGEPFELFYWRAGSYFASTLTR